MTNALLSVNKLMDNLKIESVEPIKGPPPMQSVGSGTLLGDFCPTFGDMVTNPYASDSNPSKHGYFVELIHRKGRLNPGVWYRCTNGTGRFWECGEIVPFEITEAMRRQDEHSAIHA